MALTSLASVAVAACFAVEPVHGSAAELVHAAEEMSVESAAVIAVTAAVKVIAVRVSRSVASANEVPASVCETQGNGVMSRPGCR